MRVDKNNLYQLLRGGRLRVAVVGTLKFLDPAVRMCHAAGIPLASSYPIRRYGQAFRWLASEDFRRTHLVYQFGAGGIKHMISCSCLGKPLIKHWIGTDAHRTVEAPGALAAMRRVVYRRVPAYHLAVHADVARRLEGIGIRTRSIIRTVTELSHARPSPLPERFTVLGYWRRWRKRLYNGHLFLELARQCPHMRFWVVGSDGDDEEVPPNVEFLGYREDMDAVYRQCSVLVRMPETDGAANMPMEMLARGRHVIYNRPHPHCLLARTLEEARAELDKLARTCTVNQAGADYVAQQLSLPREAAKFRRALEQWLTE